MGGSECGTVLANTLISESILEAFRESDIVAGSLGCPGLSRPLRKRCRRHGKNAGENKLLGDLSDVILFMFLSFTAEIVIA